MKNNRNILSTVLLALCLLLTCCIPALAGDGDGTGGGTGGGNSPLNVVSVTCNGAALSGATVAASGTIEITFDRGMKDNAAANAALIKITKNGSDVGASVSMGGDKSLMIVSFNGLEGGNYKLTIGSGVKANNGNTLGADYNVKFSVAAAGGSSSEAPSKSPQTGMNDALLVACAMLAIMGMVYSVRGMKQARR
ncbi:MAG: hypothetical protein E7328_06335 [Clostridiales bacterium]|nr:hypothetical protein [Clostridiales bacterium]